MPFGSHLQEIFITSPGLATSVILPRADSTASSIFCYLQMTHPMKTLVFQTTTHHLSLKYQNMSHLVYSVPTTFVLSQSLWISMNMMVHLPQGCRDTL